MTDDSIYQFHRKRKQYILNGNYHYLDDLLEELQNMEYSRNFWKRKYYELEKENRQKAESVA